MQATQSQTACGEGCLGAVIVPMSLNWALCLTLLPFPTLPAWTMNGPLGSSRMDLLLVTGGFNQLPPLARLGSRATLLTS